MPLQTAAQVDATGAAPTIDQPKTELYMVRFRWPIVGSLLGGNYDDYTRTPFSQNEMTRELFASLARRADNEAQAILEQSGYAVRLIDDLPVPQRHPPADLTLRGRIFEFELNTTGRRTVRTIEVTLSVFWDLVDARTGGVVYTKEFAAGYETELVGDRFGAFVAAVSRAFRAVFGQLVADEEFAREVSSMPN